MIEPCPEWVPTLVDELLGGSAAFAEHRASCAGCAAEADDLAPVVALLRRTAPARPERFHSVPVGRRRR